MAGFALQEILAGLDPNAKFAAPDPVAAAPAKAKLNWGAILADALSGLAGQQGQYPQRVARQEAEQREQAQWHQRRSADLEDYGRKLEMQNDPRYAKPDVAPAMRDALAWQSMTPDLQAAYRAMQAAKPQFIPDGMGGGQWAAPPQAGAPAPRAAPSGITFKPLPDGGPTPQASGGFRR